VVCVEVVGPGEVSPGQTLACEIVVRNTGAVAAAEVLVELPVPQGARVLSSQPPAQAAGSCLSWAVGTIEAHGERRLKVEMQPGGGDMRLLPRVGFTTAGGLHARVLHPLFEAHMSGPETAPRGAPVVFRITVTNHSTAPLHNVQLFDRLPSALQHPQGPTVGAPLGDLAPGETRTITLDTTAVEAGRFTNEVLAQADGGLQARARAAGTITEPSLALRLDGPRQGTTQQDLDYRLEVANPGPLPAVNLRLLVRLPERVEVVAASTGGSLDPARHALVWAPGTLAPSQRQTVTFRLRAQAAGDWPLYTMAAAEGLPEAWAPAWTVRVEGRPALSVEALAQDDPLTVGADTVYELHVFNQGDAACANVRLTVWLPEQVAPLAPTGPAAASVQGQQVSFEPLPQLQSRRDAVYRIRVQGRHCGAARLRAEVSAERERPAQAEMSIHVGDIR
jgi:uncharacterized repeat protein (TIGR01451 family)